MHFISQVLESVSSALVYLSLCLFFVQVEQSETLIGWGRVGFGKPDLSCVEHRKPIKQKPAAVNSLFHTTDKLCDATSSVSSLQLLGWVMVVAACSTYVQPHQVFSCCLHFVLNAFPASHPG